MNPFNPSFGMVPTIYLDRQQQITQLVNELENPNTPYRTSLVYGMRGSGKTAFLTATSKLLRKRPNWIVVNLAMGSEMIETLIGSIYNQTSGQLRKLLNSIEGVSFSVMGLQTTIKSTEKQVSYQVLLEEIVKKLATQGKRLFITIDEVNPTKEMIELASIYQVLLRDELPVAMMMTGLPNQISELQNHQVLTFLLRSGRVVLHPLNPMDIRKQYVKAFANDDREITKDALVEMVKLTKGYAYAFQLLGYLLWKTSAKVINRQVVESVIDDYEEALFRNAYIKIYQEVSDMDRKFLKAMAHIDDEIVNIADIREALKVSSNYIGVYRRRLMDSQIIVAPTYGKVAFSLPFFKDFINEMELYMDY